MRIIAKLTVWTAALVVVGSAAGALAAEKKGPVKVFILAGQSNMEGYGAIAGDKPGTLESLLKDPAKSPAFEHLRKKENAAGPVRFEAEASNAAFGDCAPNRVKKLKVAYRLGSEKHEAIVPEGETLAISAPAGPLVIEKAVYGDLPDGPQKDVTGILRNKSAARWAVRNDVWVWFNGRKGGLTVGFGAGKDLFGPELQFGHVMGDLLEQQVLIIKTAWGGQSLYKEFRPPSSGGEVGVRYKGILETVNQVLTNLKKEFPDYDGRGYELAGFVWWHGWNDGCDPKNAVPEYDKNLVNLIKDLRKDLNAPTLPVIVAELTGPWVTVGGEWGELRQRQAAAARSPEFAGNVLFVETHDFVREESQSPGGWACHEWNNAETYFLVGNSIGEGMKKLLAKNLSTR